MYEFDGFRVDPVNRLLLRGETPVALTPKAFDTLLVLVERSGEVVEKEELIRKVWPERFVEEGVLAQNVYTLRKALAEGEPDAQLIETVPRRGYRFAVPVRKVAAAPSGPAVPGKGRRVRTAVAVAIALAAAVVAIWWATSARRGEATRRVESLAVLPFEPLGGGEEDEILGLAMADALITRLSSVRQLVVRPTSAIRSFTGGDRDALEVGRRLAVEAVVTGAIQRSGERLRVTAQLVGMEGSSPLWADSFDATFAEIFEIQDALSERLVGALELELTSQERARLSRTSTTSTEAYQAYVRGRYFWNRRTEEGLTQAIRYFEQSIELDGDYAPAYGGLADAYVLLPLFGKTPPRDAFPQAKRAALRALALDDRLAEAHTSLAYARFIYDWEWAAAEESFKRALDLNPSYPTAHHWYAFFQSALGRHQEAVRDARRAVELDPLSLVINADLGFVYYFARRFDEAVAQYEKTLELDRDFAYAHFGLSLALVARGDFDAGVAAARRAAELAPENTAIEGALGYALAVAGERSSAEEVLRSMAGTPGVQASHLALVHSGLGEVDRALDALETAREERSRFVAFLSVWPVWDPLRDDARFDQLVGRIGLP